MKEIISAGKHVYIYEIGEGEGSRPLVLLQNHSGTAKETADILSGMDLPPFTFAAVSDIVWDDEMTPWPIPPIAEGDTPCTGGADKYIALLKATILPDIIRELPAPPAYTATAGYSLGGLFSFYAFYKTDLFDRGVSASGSLWYPDLLSFTEKTPFARKPDAFYFSLGDKESHTRNPFLRPVEKNTQILAKAFADAGIQSVFEFNPGNHFTDGALRTAKGIAWILRAK